MLPIVVRELSVVARRRETYRVRGTAGVVAVLAASWLFIVSGAGISTAQQSQMVFRALSGLCFLYALFVGVLTTCDQISSEKREGTLGLLFLTDLNGHDVVLGKLVSSSVVAFYSLLGLVPILALTLLLGGIGVRQIMLTAVALVNTMFFSLALGLLVSTLSRNERKAMFATGLLIIAFTLLPLAAIIFYPPVVSQINPVSLFFLLPSPLLSMLLADTATALKLSANFFTAVAFIHLLGWLWLFLAGGLLPRVCHEIPKKGLVARLDELWRQCSYGVGETRLAFRRKMLDQNAFSWLAARDRLKPAYAWLFLGFIGLVWLLSLWREPLLFRDWEGTALVLFLMHAQLKIWVASEVCSRLMEDRRSGAMELLLCTPLRVPEIARGQHLALRRQFLWPVVALLIADCVALVSFSGALTRTSFAGLVFMVLSAMLLLVADVLAVQWVAMSRALFAKDLNRAIWGTLGLVLALPWVLVWGFWSASLFWEYLLGRPFSMTLPLTVLLWLSFSLAADLCFGWKARRRFLTQFRSIAAGRFDAPASQPGVPLRRRVANFFQRQDSKPKEIAAGLRRRKWRWVIAAALTVVITGWGAFALYRGNLRAQLGRELAAIRAHGEPTTYAELASWINAPPPERNAALQLAPALTKLSLFFSPQGKDPASGTKYLRELAPGETWAPAARAVEGKRVQQHAEPMAIARKIGAMEESQFWTDWNSQMAPQPQRVIQLADLFRIEAGLFIEQERPEQAAQSISTIFGLARLLGTEPSATGQSLRNAVLNSGLDAIQRLLSRSAPDEPQLVRLGAMLRKAEVETDDLTQIRRGLVLGRVVLLNISEQSLPELWQRFAGMGPAGAIPARIGLLHRFLKVSGQWEAHKIAWLRDYQRAMDALRPGLAESLRSLQLLESQLPDRMGFEPILRDVFPKPHPSWLLQNQCEVLARLRAAQVAIGIERWRLQHHSLPSDPSLLVGGFLEKFPTDPFDGNALRQSRRENGYFIYSIGPSQKDLDGKIHTVGERRNPGFLVEH